MGVPDRSFFAELSFALRRVIQARRLQYDPRRLHFGERDGTVTALERCRNHDGHAYHPEDRHLANVIHTWIVDIGACGVLQWCSKQICGPVPAQERGKAGSATAGFRAYYIRPHVIPHYIRHFGG